MNRGELYRVRHPSSTDPRRCIPPITACRRRFSSEIDEGLKHDSAIHCDELVSLPKSVLTDYVGSLSAQKLTQLNNALAVALDLQGRESAE